MNGINGNQMIEKPRVLKQNNIINCIQSRSLISASLVKLLQNGNNFLPYFKILHLIGFCGDGVWAVSLSYFLNPVYILRIFYYKSFQSFQLKWLMHSVQKPYAFHRCSVDNDCNADLALMKASKNMKKSVEQSAGWFDTQKAFQHGKHSHVEFVIPMMYDHHEFYQ